MKLNYKKNFRISLYISGMRPLWHYERMKRIPFGSVELTGRIHNRNSGQKALDILVGVQLRYANEFDQSSLRKMGEFSMPRMDLCPGCSSPRH